MSILPFQHKTTIKQAIALAHVKILYPRNGTLPSEILSEMLQEIASLGTKDLSNFEPLIELNVDDALNEQERLQLFLKGISELSPELPPKIEAVSFALFLDLEKKFIDPANLFNDARAIVDEFEPLLTDLGNSIAEFPTQEETIYKASCDFVIKLIDNYVLENFEWLNEATEKEYADHQSFIDEMAKQTINEAFDFRNLLKKYLLTCQLLAKD